MTINWLILTALLLPIAALSGWWVAKRDHSNRRNQSLQGLHPGYFKGLNFVLNEQPDKAIEVFTEMLEIDSATVETHLALGNLFRRRGEIDRAIRIHQNLIARNLEADQHSLAILELGMDYMLSGLLDRAEGLFKGLADMGDYTLPANKQLLEIYQQEKDWNNAIVTARRLEQITGDKLSTTIAQFYCELADIERQQGNNKSTRELLHRALSVDKNCVRASIIEAEVALDADKVRDAIKAYQRVQKQDPEYISEVIHPLMRCYRKLGKIDDYMEYLDVVIQRHGGITPLMVLTDLIAAKQGKDAAIQFISGELRKWPRLRGVDRMIEYAVARSEGEVRSNLVTIKDLTGKLLEGRVIYRCSHCGFDAKLLHWQCPGCRHWNMVKPIHGIEGE